MTPRPTREREITEPVDLCGPDGRLAREARGWSRTPLHTDDGTTHRLDGVSGFAEGSRSRW